MAQGLSMVNANLPMPVARLKLITFHDIRVTELSITDALNEHAMKSRIYPYVIKNDDTLLLQNFSQAFAILLTCKISDCAFLAHSMTVHHNCQQKPYFHFISTSQG